MTLPIDPKERKNVPMARGLLDYFPDALAAVADVSRVGNDQHNPGQPMHWAKHLSTDHADCLIRHLVDRGRLDTDGLRHSAKVAWRALALLQTELEEEQEVALLEEVHGKPKRADHQREGRPGRRADAAIDVCADQPSMSWQPCEGCHSMVCQQIGTCTSSWKRHHD